MLKRISKKQLLHERRQKYGLLSVVLMTILGSATIAKVNRSFYREVTTNPDFAFSQITERENETARIPVSFDKVLHRPYSVGK